MHFKEKELFRTAPNHSASKRTMMNLKVAHTYLIAAVLVPVFASAACAVPTRQWGDGYKWGSKTNPPARQTNLPEAQLLQKNDNLLPGQNRTQAMRLEAETGHINPQVDSAMKPMLKPRQKVAPYVVKRTPVRLMRTTYPQSGRY
jgi:hypothetical protein